MEERARHSTTAALGESWIREALTAGLEAVGFDREAGALRSDPPPGDRWSGVYHVLAGEALRGGAAEAVRLLLVALLWTPQAWPEVDFTELRTGLAAEDALVRVAAVAALGGLPVGTPRVTGMLSASVADENAAVCRHAVDALGRVGDGSAVRPLSAVLAGEHPGFTESLIQGRPARLVELSHSISAGVGLQIRARAAAALGALWGRQGGTEVVPHLLRQFGDPAPQVRAACVAAVGALFQEARPDAFDCSTLVSAVAELLADESNSVRSAAVRVLGAAGSRRVLPELRARLRFLGGERDYGIKQEIRAAISRIEEATEHLAAVPLASSPPAPASDTLPRVSEDVEAPAWDRPIPARDP